jgi:tRNA(Arg) A34 adenosine deaminase TadA
MRKNLTPRELALDLLDRSSCKVQVSAVLSDNYGIFSWGWNSPPTNPNKIKGVHAEAHAIRRANSKRLKNATLTIAARRRKSRTIILSRPCENCMSIIKNNRIKRAEYTTKDSTWETILFEY